MPQEDDLPKKHAVSAMSSLVRFRSLVLY